MPAIGIVVYGSGGGTSHSSCRRSSTRRQDFCVPYGFPMSAGQHEGMHPTCPPPPDCTLNGELVSSGLIATTWCVSTFFFCRVVLMSPLSFPACHATCGDNSARKFLGEALRRQGEVHRGGLGGQEHGPHPGVVQRHAGGQHTQGDYRRPQKKTMPGCIFFRRVSTVRTVGTCEAWLTRGSRFVRVSGRPFEGTFSRCMLAVFFETHRHATYRRSKNSGDSQRRGSAW